MRLPNSKRRQIEKKGGPQPRKGAGGGAAARVQLVQKQRGITKGGTGSGGKARDRSHGSSDE